MAKVASKTNPTRKKGSKATKMYDGTPVQPFKFISRHTGGENTSYMAAESESGDIIMDKNGTPIRWNSI